MKLEFQFKRCSAGDDAHEYGSTPLESRKQFAIFPCLAITIYVYVLLFLGYPILGFGICGKEKHTECQSICSSIMTGEIDDEDGAIDLICCKALCSMTIVAPGSCHFLLCIQRPHK